MTALGLWLQLGGATVVILVAATFLTKSADRISDATGLGRSLIGLVLLATATSLPELVTGLSSVMLVDAPDLAAGAAFGSNMVNLLMIGLLDAFWRSGVILDKLGPAFVAQAVFGIAMITLASAGVLIHTSTSSLDGWFLSPVSLLLVATFLVAMYTVFSWDKTHPDSDDNPDNDALATPTRLAPALGVFVLAASVVFVCAIWLARTGDSLATEMGWEASFVGTQLLAVSTSLPELATSVAALRMRAPEFAISNLLGSNLFNMGIVLFAVDIAYTKGTIWAALSGIHALTGLIAVFMTTMVVLGLVALRSTTSRRAFGAESVMLIALYIAASSLVFLLG